MKLTLKKFYFDGKIAQEFSNGRKSTRDRITVSVNYVGKNTLLRKPNLYEFRRRMADLLKSFKLKREFVSMVFYTTPSNTGTKNGVSTRLKKHFQRPFSKIFLRYTDKSFRIIGLI